MKAGAPAETSRRNGRKRGIGTRSAIQRAATHLFAEFGYHATSMQRISAAAHVQPAAIYHWFPNKEAILVHLQDDFMLQLNRAVAELVDRQADPAGRLAGAVRAHVVHHGLHTKEAFVTDSEIRALTEQPRAAFIEQRDRYQHLFERLIQDGVDDGSFSVTSARIATYAILLQCTGVAMWFKADGPLSIDQIADLHVEFALGSLGAPRGLIERTVAAVRPAAVQESGR